MPFDPVYRGQLLVRRAGEVLRPAAEQVRRVDSYDEQQLAVEYERGERAFATLAARMQRFLGHGPDSRRALDYGCGMGRLALPLARRCEHVYGLDISPDVLRQADRAAKRLGIENVEWSDASRLDELHGSYDLAISMFVLQHIPSREGERIFSRILAGLAPGGIGAVHFTLRPGGPQTGSAQDGDGDGDGQDVRASHAGRRINRNLPYMLVHSYSLNRIARLLAREGITEWHVKWHARPGSYDTAVVFFHKE
jgi:SAM-dependent methyltransferase